MSPASDSHRPVSLTVPMEHIIRFGDRHGRRRYYRNRTRPDVARPTCALSAAHLTIDRVVVYVHTANCPRPVSIRRPRGRRPQSNSARSSYRVGQGPAHEREEVDPVAELLHPSSATICSARMSSRRRGSSIASACPRPATVSRPAHLSSFVARELQRRPFGVPTRLSFNHPRVAGAWRCSSEADLAHKLNRAMLMPS